MDFWDTVWTWVLLQTYKGAWIFLYKKSHDSTNGYSPNLVGMFCEWLAPNTVWTWVLLQTYMGAWTFLYKISRDSRNGYSPNLVRMFSEWLAPNKEMFGILCTCASFLLKELEAWNFMRIHGPSGYDPGHYYNYCTCAHLSCEYLLWTR